MSKPVTEDLFKFSGRRNRKSYVFFLLAAIAIQIVVSLIAAGLGAVSEILGMVVGIIAIVIYIALFVASLAVASQRCRDFGTTGWAVLLFIIPLVNLIFALVLMFIPGNPGDNRYGPDPLQGMA